MPVNPTQNRKCQQTVVATIPLVVVVAMAIGAIMFPIAVAVAALS